MGLAAILGQWTTTFYEIFHSPAPEVPEEKSSEILKIFSHTNL